MIHGKVLLTTEKWPKQKLRNTCLFQFFFTDNWEGKTFEKQLLSRCSNGSLSLWFLRILSNPFFSVHTLYLAYFAGTLGHSRKPGSISSYWFLLLQYYSRALVLLDVHDIRTLRTICPRNNIARTLLCPPSRSF